MRRLDFKIFLWFWLGVIVVSGTLVTLTELTHSRTQDDASWRTKYGPRVDLWARQETHILRTQGPKALETYVGSFQSDPGVLNYVFDGKGTEVLGRRASNKVRRMVASMDSFERWSQSIDPHERIIAEKAVDALGNPYVVVVDFPGPSILNRSLSEFLAEDPQSGGLNSTSIGRLAAVLIVAGVFCFMLARHIARPIERLRAAAGQIADQQLETRVDRRVLNRRDELADLGRDFDKMAERIETLVTAQRRLLADVSHALRSPLARLNVALGLARRQGDPGSAVHLDRIEGETERLNTLIGQLLTMARVEGGLDLERQSVFDLGQVVAEVAADADYEARNRHCTVRFDQRCECTVEGAREMLRGAVENVVRNAVRHTADHTTVEIAMDYRLDAGRPRAVIEVRDHGPGVPGEAVANLFTPFHRVVNADTDTSNRTGLGLAITRRAFEVHGGTATAANAPGGGFVVTLEMPLRLQESGATPRAADDSPAAFSRLRAPVKSAAVSGMFLIALSGASLSSQHAGTSGPAFHGRVDLVAMDVAVADAQHEPVPDLTQADFSVFEDGVEQQLSFFATHRVPLDTALVFDTSGSMAGELPAVQKCGAGLIASLAPDDRASVVELKERVNILQPLTSEQADLGAAMTHLVEGGETALYDGLYVALAQLGSRPRHAELRSGVLVIVTDGADTTSLVTFDQLVEQARRQATAIYVVRLQSKELSRELSKREIVAAHRAMDVLAVETGGRVRTAEHGDLSSLCGTIASELAERYTVGYVSSNTRRDGGYRRISVRVTGRPELIARTRAGYISK